MNRFVVLIAALVVTAVLGGAYHFREKLFSGTPAASLSTSNESSAILSLPTGALTEPAVSDAVEAVRFDVTKPPPRTRNTAVKTHPVDYLAACARRGGMELLNNLLRVRISAVQGNYYMADSDVIAIAGVRSNPWIWDAPLEAVEEQLRASPWIGAVQLSWGMFPLTVRVNLTEAKPWLVAELGKESWLISRTGALLQPMRTLRDTQLILDTVGLPRLDGLVRSGETPDAATTMSDRLGQAVAILSFYRIAEDFPFPVDRFTLLPEGGILISPQQRGRYPGVIVDSTSFSDAAAASANLRRVLADLEQRGEKAARIDLRFNGQAVVRLEQPQETEKPKGKQTDAKVGKTKTAQHGAAVD